MVAWTRCKYGHDLTDPTNVATIKGRKRCRTCKRASDNKTRADRRNNIRAHNKPVRTYPDRYRSWAAQTWATMTPYDQWIVRHALTTMELP